MALLLQRVQNEEVFCNMIYCEMRTALNAVLGMSELLSEFTLPSEQHEMVNCIEHNGKVITELLGDMRYYAQYDLPEIYLIHDLSSCSLINLNI